MPETDCRIRNSVSRMMTPYRKSWYQISLSLTAAMTSLPLPGLAQNAASDVVRLSDCGIGGGTILSPRSATSFALSVRNDSLYIDGIIIARAQPGWRGFYGTRQQLVEPLRAGAPKYLAGSTIDTLFLQFDTKARIAWIHTVRVPMDTNNVVLVDRIDARGGPPRLSGLLKVPSPIAVKGACGDKNFVENSLDALDKMLRSVPAIATFIGVPLPREP